MGSKIQCKHSTIAFASQVLSYNNGPDHTCRVPFSSPPLLFFFLSQNLYYKGEKYMLDFLARMELSLGLCPVINGN